MTIFVVQQSVSTYNKAGDLVSLQKGTKQSTDSFTEAQLQLLENQGVITGKKLVEELPVKQADPLEKHKLNTVKPEYDPLTDTTPNVENREISQEILNSDPEFAKRLPEAETDKEVEETFQPKKPIQVVEQFSQVGVVAEREKKERQQMEDLSSYPQVETSQPLDNVPEEVEITKKAVESFISKIEDKKEDATGVDTVLSSEAKEDKETSDSSGTEAKQPEALVEKKKRRTHAQKLADEAREAKRKDRAEKRKAKG